jgi:O-antigen/teichoic acid export membrane protein
MLLDAPRGEVEAAISGPQISALWRLRGQLARRLSWGVADQAMSSLTNFAVVILVAHSLGAVKFGAFSLAYVTYGLALNVSRGLASYPLQVRFSGADLPTWRRAVANCTGTALVLGLVSGTFVLAAAALLGGATRTALLALGLTLPGLLLQDNWRYAFFTLGRGSQAFLNDCIWAAAQIPALVLLHATGTHDVFWFVLAWGGAACVAAAVGPLQARVIPKMAGVQDWVSQHRDLGARYAASDLIGSAAVQLRTYGVDIILGLAAVGYVQAAGTLMGPFMIIFYGIGLVTVPEAVRALRRAPQRLPLVCMLVGGGLAAAALAWGVLLLLALPRGLGSWILGPIWRPTYPLVLPQILVVICQGFSSGASTGLGALGAARRNLRATIIGSVSYLGCGLVGALLGGPAGTMYGSAIAAGLNALVLWWQLRAAVREAGIAATDDRFWSGRPSGRHRSPMTERKTESGSKGAEAPIEPQT